MLPEVKMTIVKRLLELKNDLWKMVFGRPRPEMGLRAPSPQPRTVPPAMPVFPAPSRPPIRPPAVEVPVVDQAKCTACGDCVAICAMDAISVERTPEIDETKCIGCGACVALCPEQALSTAEAC
jgi:ferredoxin